MAISYDENVVHSDRFQLRWLFVLGTALHLAGCHLIFPFDRSGSATTDALAHLSDGGRDGSLGDRDQGVPGADAAMADLTVDGTMDCTGGPLSGWPDPLLEASTAVGFWVPSNGGLRGDPGPGNQTATAALVHGFGPLNTLVHYQAETEVVPLPSDVTAVAYAGPGLGFEVQMPVLPLTPADQIWCSVSYEDNAGWYLSMGRCQNEYCKELQAVPLPTLSPGLKTTIKFRVSSGSVTCSATQTDGTLTHTAPQPIDVVFPSWQSLLVPTIYAFGTPADFFSVRFCI